MATIQFGGIASGLNTTALIEGLVKVERRSIDLLQTQGARYQAQQGVLSALASSLASVKSAAQGLSFSVDFNRHTISSSDETAVKATANSAALLGSYVVNVSALAKAAVLQSTGYTSTTSAIGQGTVTINVGSVSKNITIDATNNTLTGLRDAINNSGADVTASIVNVGPSSAPDYRLVVQSKNTGVANALTISDSLANKSAASSDNSVLTATADASAAVGSYDIDVTTLAKAKSVKSAQFLTSGSGTGTGTLTLSVGGVNTNITVNGSNNTLTGLRDAINNSGADVTASVVQEGALDYRLVVTSNKTGAANAVNISGTLSGGTNPFPGGGTVVQDAVDAQFTVNGVSHTRSSNTISDVISGVDFTLHKANDSATLNITGSNGPFSGGGTVVQAAADASFTVNGLPLTRSSNTVSDVISGVTLSLLKEGGASSTVTVNKDTSSVKDNIKKLVDTYNGVAKLVADQFTLNGSTGRQGVLAGDSTARAAVSRLRAAFNGPSGLDGSIRSLSDLGIRFQRDGSLQLDEAKLSSALSTDPEAVQKLFLKSENGIGKRIPDAVDSLIDSVSGAITARQNGITKTLVSLEKKIAREEGRIAAYEARLTAQFTSLEKLVSQLNQQGDFLSQKLNTSTN